MENSRRVNIISLQRTTAGKCCKIGEKILILTVADEVPFVIFFVVGNPHTKSGEFTNIFAHEGDTKNTQKKNYNF